MTLKEEFEQRKDELINDAALIHSASTYTEQYLMHGSCCDSSVRAKERIKFVKQAEGEFINKYRTDILKRAAELCIESIG